jgi:hypothetical protein
MMIPTWEHPVEVFGVKIIEFSDDGIDSLDALKEISNDKERKKQPHAITQRLFGEIINSEV